MSVMTRRQFAAWFAVSVCHTTGLAASWPWSAPDPQMREFRDPQGHYRFRYPAKDWHLVRGGARTLLTLVHKTGDAAVFVTYETLQIALASNEIADLFAELESETIQKEHPTAEAIRSAVVEHNGRPLVVLDFRRAGVTRHEGVRSYVYVAGRDVYRVVCSAPADRFDKYEPAFAAIAAGFAHVAERSGVPSGN